MGFTTTPKSAPNLAPSPSFGDGKHEQFANTLIYNIKLCCDVSRINNFQRQKCSCICLEYNCDPNFETDAYSRILK